MRNEIISAKLCPNGYGLFAQETKTMRQEKFYIAYGSNLHIRQMKERCPQARIIGTAVMEDYQLLVRRGDSGAYLTIEPKEGYSVPVGVWAVEPEDEAALDEYEGFPRLYEKKEMQLPVTLRETGETKDCRAFFYVMYQEYPLGSPTEEYKETCRQGYRDFGFDEAVLEAALTE